MTATGNDREPESRTKQRQCVGCLRWFWPWSAHRTRCYVCEPLAPATLRQVLQGIQSGEVRL